jgi:hypothetical protein
VGVEAAVGVASLADAASFDDDDPDDGVPDASFYESCACLAASCVPYACLASCDDLACASFGAAGDLLPAACVPDRE